jgi:hypothetical protein
MYMGCMVNSNMAVSKFLLWESEFILSPLAKRRIDYSRVTGFMDNVRRLEC